MIRKEEDREKISVLFAFRAERSLIFMDVLSPKNWNRKFFQNLNSFIVQNSRLAHADLCELMKQYPELRLPSFQPPLEGNGFQIAVENGDLSVKVTDYAESRKFIDGTINLSEVSQSNVALMVAAIVLRIPVESEELCRKI